MKYEFVEIGCSDFETILQEGRKGKGISIEPLGFYLDNLPASEDVLKVRVAISDKNEFRKIFWVSPENIRRYNLPEWVKGCNKLDTPHPAVVRILQNNSIEWAMREEELECITFQTLAERYNITEISHLKIDTEGYDLTIIRSMMDYGKIFPSLITFEINKDFVSEQELGLTFKALEEKGYRIAYWGVSNITLEKKPKILILSFYNEKYRKMANTTIFDNFRKYCLIHGYDLISENITGYNFERAPQWFKIQMLLKNLKTGYDWLFFMDCDSLFMDFTQKIEDWIDPNYDIILPSHSFCEDYSKTNDGLISSQMIIKDSDFSKKILQEIWESPDLKPEEIDTFDHEQMQMRISFLKPQNADKIKYVGDKSFNSSWYVNNPHMHFTFPTLNKRGWEPGDFILHLTGYETEPRTNLINQMSFFVGGKIAAWIREGEKIYFRPLEDLKDVRIVLLSTEKKELINWNFEELQKSVIYFLIIEETMDLSGLVLDVKSGDKKISLHTFL